VKIDHILDSIEQLDDLLYLKNEYRLRMEQLVEEIQELYTAQRKPFDAALAEQFTAWNDNPTRHNEAAFDGTLAATKAYTSRILPLLEEHKLLKLKHEALESRIAHQQGATGATLLDRELGLTPTPLPNKPQKALSLKAISEKWLAQKARNGELKERSEQTYRQALAKLFYIVDPDIDVHDFDKATAVAYADQLADYPKSRWKGKGRDLMTLEEVRAIESGRLSTSAVNAEMQVVGSLCVWLVQRGHLTSNPVEGLSPKINKADRSREPFTREEVVQIFSHPCFRGKKPTKWHKPLRAHYYWMPILGLFTGARIEELAQLRKKDIREINGIMAIDVMPSDLTSEVTTRRKSTPGKSAAASRL
jgi:integrase